MGRIGIWELAIIVILVIIIFGARKLPELGKGLGQGLASFRQAMRDTDQPADKSGPKAEADSSDRAEGGLA
ncbi:MAG: twin-arginine translocase TatA/TatE family subunit [Deltaproteobacteria bacterium]|nr:twin-arginine translocase TatA/TatE family subunit [Deltaproteobacteria bacterium]